MRASRLLSILILLQLRTRLTADALAEEFGVSVRTIYRDIDELSASGVPVFADRGPGGGFQLVEGYRTKLTGLARDEADAVLMIGLPKLAHDLGMGQAASRARNKLLAALPQEMTTGAGRLGARFHLDPVDWYREAEATPFLPALAEAVLDDRRVQLTYESWTGLREWRVAPLGLVLKSGTWYVVVQGRGRAGDERLMTFRVANIRDFALMDEGFKRPKGFDLTKHWAQSLARFEDSLRPHRAQLLLRAEGCKRLGEAGAYAAIAVRAAGEPDADGWCRVSLPYENLDQAARLLLSLGPSFRILAPTALKTLIATMSQSILSIHQDKNIRLSGSPARATVPRLADAAQERPTGRPRAQRMHGAGPKTLRKGDVQ
ncbi:MAG: YafY family protein [Burkholderiales bacterium]|nr:YafY family protein [Burkholderiales bacterium]